jgi:hypothetical protein
MIVACFSGKEVVAEQPGCNCKCGPGCQSLYNTPYDHSWSYGFCYVWS